MNFSDKFHYIKNFVQVDYFENILKNFFLEKPPMVGKFFNWQKLMRIDARLLC